MGTLVSVAQKVMLGIIHLGQGLYSSSHLCIQWNRQRKNTKYSKLHNNIPQSAWSQNTTSSVNVTDTIFVSSSSSSSSRNTRVCYWCKARCWQRNGYSVVVAAFVAAADVSAAAAAATASATPAVAIAIAGPIAIATAAATIAADGFAIAVVFVTAAAAVCCCLFCCYLLLQLLLLLRLLPLILKLLLPPPLHHSEALPLYPSTAQPVLLAV